jgi:hypothetical protein
MFLGANYLYVLTISLFLELISLFLELISLFLELISVDLPVLPGVFYSMRIAVSGADKHQATHGQKVKLPASLPPR